jgi:hypothetical protein
MDNQITLNDLATVVNIIDVCSQRGAFKGDELVVVGTLRQKFADTVKENMPKEEAKTENESAE